MRIALAMIVKGDDKEAELLDRCLENMSPYVDGIFITRTQPNKKVGKVCKKYGAVLSDFKWINEFAAARNFNFSQVPKDYDYIIWSDADDMWRGLEKLKPEIEKYPNVEAFGMWYLYDFDENKSPTVVHKKTMVVKNDGCVSWQGVLHEDLVETRSITTVFLQGIERMHFTTEERLLSAKSRNVDVAQHDVELNPNDPRALWNLGNSYLGNFQYEKAYETLQEFVKKTHSNDEKYLSFIRLGDIAQDLGKKSEAEEWLWKAIGMKPTHPDAMFNLGYVYFKQDRLNDAENYLLLGLTMKPKYDSVIVYNPRDYDYNPMMALSKIYVRKGRADLALPLLEGCLKIAPNNEYLKKLVPELQKEKNNLEQAAVFVKEHENDDDKTLMAAMDALPKKLQAHPAVSILRNKRFIKTESSGKDIAYYCGMTDFDWNPELFKTKGFGGSEEAVVNLSREWAKMGYTVTVYNSCGDGGVYDGVTYRPWWTFNARDKVDTLIVWRHPKILDFELNAKKILIDLHDVVKEGEFTEKRLKKIDKIMVKTKFHRSLFPSIPDEKFNIVPNGIDVNMIRPQNRDHKLIVNTSSPDRSLDVLPELFVRVKERVPDAKCVWVYGWDNFKSFYSGDKDKMEWMEKTIRAMEEAGIESRGRVTQQEAMDLCGQAKVFAYPTEFAEIDCISAKKAQAAGAIPVTTDFGALDESVKYGYKVHSKKTKDNWSLPYQFTFGITDEETKLEWVDSCITALNDDVDTEEMMEYGKKFAWPNIAPQWPLV